MNKKIKVAFVCTGNSCRSQMAEGFAKHYGSDLFEVFSAGTHPTKEINPNAIKVMNDIDVSLNGQFPKTLDDIPSEIDILITMGCGVVCPFIFNHHQEDWGLDDPVGKPIEEFERVRDIIKEKVINLVGKTNNDEIFL